jgi:hypothetical protein
MSSLEQLHRECAERLRPVLPPGDSVRSVRTRGLLPPLLGSPDLPAAAYYVAWYLIAGGLSLIGARLVGLLWKSPEQKKLEAAQKQIDAINASLDAMKRELREALAALRAGRSPRTDGLDRSLVTIQPALQGLSDQFRGAVPADQTAALRAAVSADAGERVTQFDIRPPLANQIGEQFGEALVAAVGAAPPGTPQQ